MLACAGKGSAGRAPREQRRRARNRSSVYLYYWCTSTNTDAAAAAAERIPREEIVVDRKMVELMRERGDARVLHTKQSIISENRNKEVYMSRIKALAWDSMHVHGAQVINAHTHTHTHTHTHNTYTHTHTHLHI